MSSSKQGFYSKLTFTPRTFRHFMNLWPPFWGMRIHIEHIAEDWKTLRMRMKLSLTNKNYVGSQFGGGLFSMTDPFYMLMLMHLLGRDYLVWDKSAKIDFIAPGRSTVYAHFQVTDEMLAEIRAKTETGEKFEPIYRVDVVDAEGKIVARVEKTMYIRKKRPAP
jgi:acyl-coenzyme A thioesterase PaaI-like protein